MFEAQLVDGHRQTGGEGPVGGDADRDRVQTVAVVGGPAEKNAGQLSDRGGKGP
ncbi:hypothetical protein [Streptomyces sp. NPDC005009]